MYREADVSAIEAAWTARDRAALATLGERLGVALELEPLAMLFKRAQVRRRDVIATLLEAATYERGLALFATDGWVVLAVRTDDGVTCAVARGDRPSKAWPELAPWQRDPARNRTRAMAWARTPAADRVMFACVTLAVPAALPTDDDLVRQVIERPDDPAPREVLTDLWLARDDVRGKLAKLDAEIAALPVTSADRKKREVMRASVIAQHGARIAGESAGWVSAYTLRAGFVEEVSLTGAAFRDHGAQLFARQPIRRVRVTPANTAAMTALAKGPVAQIRELELHGTAALSLAPLRTVRFDTLEVLAIHGGAQIDDASTFAALHAPRLRRLEFLTAVHATTLRGLAHNRAICDQLEALVIEPMLPPRARLPDEDLTARAVFDHELVLPRLRVLHARIWYVTQASIAALRPRAPLLVDVEPT